MYRAFALRRALVDPPYRTRAFWTGIGGLSIILFVSAGIVDNIVAAGTGVATNWGALIAEDVIWGAVFISLYGWIVSNINVGLSADFFHRDALLWNRGGKIAAVVALFTAYTSASLPSWLLPQLGSNLFQLIFSGIFGASVLYPTLVLLLTYLRTRDRRIKTYTMWVALSVSSLLLFLIIPVILVGGFIMVFCMYRAATSLAIRTHTISQT